MIKLLNILGESGGDGNMRAQMVSLFADTKAEVEDTITGEDVEGMLDDVDVDTGSIVRTASFDIGTLNSSHVWVWKG